MGVAHSKPLNSVTLVDDVKATNVIKITMILLITNEDKIGVVENKKISYFIVKNFGKKVENTMVYRIVVNIYSKNVEMFDENILFSIKRNTENYIVEQVISSKDAIADNFSTVV